MKKKTAPKKAPAKKTVKRTAPRPTHSSTGNQTILFRRIVIISACLVLVVGVASTLNSGSVRQEVAGARTMAGLFNQANVDLPAVPNAVSYNIYYKAVGDQTFSNAVRNIPSDVHSYTISDLKKGTTYEFYYSAVDNTGKEFLFSPVKPLTNVQPM
jgi:fibronectin type III domain protein